jgi:hypothetical protein
MKKCNLDPLITMMIGLCAVDEQNSAELMSFCSCFGLFELAWPNLRVAPRIQHFGYDWCTGLI